MRRLVLFLGVFLLVLSILGFLQRDARPLGDLVWFSTTENFVHVVLGVALFAAGIAVPEGDQRWTLSSLGLIALVYGIVTVIVYLSSSRLWTSPADMALHLVIGFGALALGFNTRVRRFARI